MNRTVRLSVLLGLGILAGCRAAPPTPPDTEDPWAHRAVAPSEILTPRMVTYACEEEPGRPLLVLDRWLTVLGPRLVRERSEGVARLMRGGGEYREYDYLVLWRTQERGLDVQVACPSGLLGDEFKQCLASLAFVMEANGISHRPGLPSGCFLAEKMPPGFPNLGDAIRAEIQAMGLVELRNNPEMDANVSYYGPEGGQREWQVICADLESPFNPPSIEISHDTVPFDAEGERDLLVRILKRLGVTDHSRLD